MKEGTDMTSVSQISQALQRTLTQTPERLGRETGFVQRQSKLTATDFVQTVIFAWLQEPDITLDGLTQVLGRRQVSITASGLSQRFGPEAASLMQRMLEELSAQALSSLAVEIPLLRRFSAVIVEDSSSITLPLVLHEQWPGCGNHGAEGKASLKLFARWDVLRGRLEGPALCSGRHSDKRSPFEIERLPAGSLYLADLGFYSAHQLTRIKGGMRGKSQRYFVSRYMPRTALRDRHGKRLDLLEVAPRVEGMRLQRVVVLGSERLVVRVVMERVPEQVANERRQRIREAAADHGREPDAETLALAGWTILLTNAPSRLLSAEELLVLMRLRWQIELLFKLWKEEGRIDEWRSMKPWRILCEIYAKLAAMVIQQWLITAGTWHDPHRSLHKAAQVVRREAGSLMIALGQDRLESALEAMMPCFASGCHTNRRASFPNTAQFLLGLPLTWPKKRHKPKKRRPGGHRWPAGKGWAYAKDRRKILA
jgi:hypothetical protein